MNEDGDDRYWWKWSYLTSKWSKNENPEKSRNFFLNPGIKNIGKSRPEKSRDPGIWQNPVPKNPGIEILDPARAWCWPYFWYVHHIYGMFTIFLVLWPYFWYIGHISGMLTLSLVFLPYFWYVDRTSGMVTIFLVCWPYFWSVDHSSGVLTIFLVCWP